MTKRSPKRKIGPNDPGFVLEDYVLYNLVRATATYNEEMSAALKAYGLDIMKWRILMLLDDSSPSSVGEIARRSVTKMPTVTRMLTRMENEGLIMRRALEGDRRIIEVTMTAKAAKTLAMVKSIGQKVFERAFEGVSTEEIASIMRLLKRVRSNLARSPYETLAGRARFAKVSLSSAPDGRNG